MGEYEQALAYHRKDSDTAQEIGDISGESRALSNLAIVYQHLDDYDQALTHYQQALAIAQKTGEIQRQVRLLHNMGGLYSAQGNILDEIECQQESLANRANSWRCEC